MQSNLTLVPLKINHAPYLLKWFKDKENVKYMSSIIRCEKHTLKGIKNDIKINDLGFQRLFMVYLKRKKDPIGHAGIDDFDFDDKRGEIFFLIGDKKEHGRGYGKEIVNLLLDYGFKKLHFNSIFASSVITNISSQKILEASGFKKIGIRRGYNLINDKFLDEVFYDITIDDYKKLNRYKN